MAGNWLSSLFRGDEPMPPDESASGAEAPSAGSESSATPIAEAFQEAMRSSHNDQGDAPRTAADDALTTVDAGDAADSSAESSPPMRRAAELAEPNDAEPAEGEQIGVEAIEASASEPHRARADAPDFPLDADHHGVASPDETVETTESSHLGDRSPTVDTPVATWSQTSPDHSIAAAAAASELGQPANHLGEQPEGNTRVSALDQPIQELLSIDGASGAAIVDISSGMALATGGNPGFDLDVAAAGNSNVVRAKLKTMSDLGVQGNIEDILITLDSQYHLINVLNGDANKGLFIYLVLNRSNANLALARHKLNVVARNVRL